MKKRMIKQITILLVVIVFITIVILAVALDQRYNMRHYFDDWKQETDEKIVHILGDSNVDGRLNIDHYVDGRIEDIYCVRNERIYFFYSTAIPDSYPDRIWHIASIGVNGEKLTDHFSDNLFYETNPLGYSYEYKQLCYESPTSENYGGIYSNGKIYLHGKDITVVYDIDNDTVSETEGYPIGKYRWNIEDHKAITIEDTEQNIFRTVTLESMAEHNDYAKELLNLSTRKIWSGDSPTKQIFAKVKIIDNQIYIVCEVLNWLGESFAVIFRYDISSDEIRYLSSKKVGDVVSSNYSFVLCEP